MILDYDLAKIYGYEVKRLNEQVKRNTARFPKDFMFQLTRDEEVFCMATTNLNIRTDKAIKDQAEEIFNELGLNMTTAVNMFQRTAIREHGIPFELKLEVPNETTAAAIEEGRKMLSDSSAPRYSSMDALKEALEV